MNNIITVRYSAVDGYSAVKKFKTLAGARRYAQKMVGKNPDFGSYYAVSGDGIGKIEVIGGGFMLSDLFGDEPSAGPPAGEFKIYVVEGAGTYYATRTEAEVAVTKFYDDGYGVLPIQVYTVTKEDFR